MTRAFSTCVCMMKSYNKDKKYPSNREIKDINILFGHGDFIKKMYEQAGLPKPNVFNCQAFFSYCC